MAAERFLRTAVACALLFVLEMARRAINCHCLAAGLALVYGI